jgi:hypothetical protein
MQYICLGYLEPGKFEGLTDRDRHAVLDECFEHNDHLRANGHLVAEAPIQPPEAAVTGIPEDLLRSDLPIAFSTAFHHKNPIFVTHNLY